MIKSNLIWDNNELISFLCLTIYMNYKFNMILHALFLKYTINAKLCFTYFDMLCRYTYGHYCLCLVCVTVPALFDRSTSSTTYSEDTYHIADYLAP